MKRTLLLTYFLIFIASVAVVAQNQNIGGRVIDDLSGEVLPGVNVIIKGTTNGTATGIDGTFNLSVPMGATLVFSYVGMRIQEIPLANFANDSTTQMVTQYYLFPVFQKQALSKMIKRGSYANTKQNLPSQAIGSLKDW